MRNKTVVGIALLVLAQGVAGCGGTDSSSTPLGPSPVAPQAAPPPPRPPGSWLAGYTLTGVSLSGVVYESTPTGRVPIAGVNVYCELCGELTHTWTTADANGFYIFSGDLANGGGVWLSGQPTPLLVAKDGYGDPAACLPGFSCREILINGDTRFDIELVRR
jgi:hypothetical protein